MQPSDRIKALIESSELSYVDLEKATGISKSALQRYASGGTKKLPIDVIEKLAPVLGVTAAYIMGWEKEELVAATDNELSKTKKEFIEFINTLSDDQVMRVRELVETALHLGDQ